jgi:hypothetical protein
MTVLASRSFSPGRSAECIAIACPIDYVECPPHHAAMTPNDATDLIFAWTQSRRTVISQRMAFRTLDSMSVDHPT